MTDTITIRASSLPQFSDCPRRFAARTLYREIEALGYGLTKSLPPSTPALSDLTPPIPLSPEELPGLQRCDVQFCKFNPAEASDIIQAAHALICNLVLERDTYRDGFEARNDRNGVSRLAPIKRAEALLEKQKPTRQEARGL
jgi:hypothetical protein